LWIIVGLGNPGKQYSLTRHNAGFIFVRRIAKNWKVRLRKRIFQSKAIETKRMDETIMLAMPQTFMNNSGWAVKQILDGRDAGPADLIVVYDDLDIPLGEIRIRKEGSAGSHKGMKSIIQEINSASFPRIRIGVGPLEFGADAADYVLSPFKEDEKPDFEKSLKKAEDALDLILSSQIEKAMNIYNKKTTEF
jgi:PTH1 family peptidyl-tRNA hydrolase